MVRYILALSNRNERSFIIWNNLFPPTTLTFLSAWIPFIGHLTVSWHFGVLFIVEKHLFASAKFQIPFLKNTQKQKTQNFMKIKLFQCLKHPVWDLANHSVMREAFCYRCPYIVEIGHPNRTGGRRLACLNRDLLWDQEKKKRVYNLCKKWQATQEAYKDVRLCWEKIRRAKPNWSYIWLLLLKTIKHVFINT